MSDAWVAVTVTEQVRSGQGRRCRGVELTSMGSEGWGRGLRFWRPDWFAEGSPPRFDRAGCHFHLSGGSPGI
jgi:hypothetical protein